MEKIRKTITIVGCGPGSVEYLTAIAVREAEGADVLVGAERLLKLFDNARARRIVVDSHIEAALDEIEAQAEDTNVVVLVSGDPGVFSLSRSVLKRFGRDRCSVIPGISSVQVAFARVGLNWQDAKIISAHHELPEITKADIGTVDKIAILAGRSDITGWLVKFVDALPWEASVIVCENLTLENEQIRELDINDINGAEIASMSVIVVVKKELL